MKRIHVLIFILSLLYIYQPITAASPDTTLILTALGGECDGTVSAKIVDPNAITNHTYKIVFADSAIHISGGDTTSVTGFTLIDTNENDTIFYNCSIPDTMLPVVDGFQLFLQDTIIGVKYMGWTKVLADTCDFYWDVYPIGANDYIVYYTAEDFKIIIDTVGTGGLTAYYYDLWAGVPTDSTTHLPLNIFVFTDTLNPINVSQNTWLGEFLSSPFGSFSPLGWDLIPGGAGYSPYYPYPDRIIMEYIDALGDTSGLRLVTNNGPLTAIPPSNGDEFTIISLKPFRKEIYYTFNFNNLTIEKDKGIEQIPTKVVLKQNYPNPFNPVTTISFTLSHTQFVTLKIYDIQGKEIKNLVSGKMKPGLHDIVFNASELTSGLYFYKLQTKRFIQTRKMLFIK